MAGTKDPRAEKKVESRKSDLGFTIKYDPHLPPGVTSEVRALLPEPDQAAFDHFIDRIRHPVCAHRAQRQARAQTPTSKDQTRYLTKLESKLKRLSTLVEDTSMLLEEAPFDLRRAATAAKCPIQEVQSRLVGLIQVLNEIGPAKSRRRPETRVAIQQIATAFREAFGVEPHVRAIRTEDEIRIDAPTEDRFVPVVSLLLSLSRDYIYRMAKEHLSS